MVFALISSENRKYLFCFTLTVRLLCHLGSLQLTSGLGEKASFILTLIMIATDVLSLNPTMIRFHPTTITRGSLLLLTCSSRRRFLIFFLCSLCLLLIRSRSTFLSIKSASRIKSRDSATEIPPTWRLWLSLRGTGSSVSLDDSGLPVWSRGAPSIVTGCKLSIDSNAVLSMGAWILITSYLYKGISEI